MPQIDFLVIGAGIAGVSIASELAAHASVAVIEREAAPVCHATSRSTSNYISSAGPALTRHLTAASRAFLLDPPDDFSAGPLLKRRGCMTVAGPRQAGGLSSRLVELATCGIEAQLVDAGAARRIVPALNSAAVTAALFEPDAGDIDAPGLLTGYVRRTMARGGQLLLTSEAVGVSRLHPGWRVALANGETLEARVIINAAGAWADEVARMAGTAPRGLQSRRQTTVLVDMPERIAAADWPILMDAADTHFCRPESGGLLVSPCDDQLVSAGDPSPDRQMIATAMGRLEGALDISGCSVRHAWAGLRTFAPDRAPLFGYDGELKDFFWFAGQGAWGVQTAPAAARLGAALALRGNMPVDLAGRGVRRGAFAPDRRLSLPSRHRDATASSPG